MKKIPSDVRLKAPVNQSVESHGIQLRNGIITESKEHDCFLLTEILIEQLESMVTSKIRTLNFATPTKCLHPCASQMLNCTQMASKLKMKTEVSKGTCTCISNLENLKFDINSDQNESWKSSKLVFGFSDIALYTSQSTVLGEDSQSKVYKMLLLICLVKLYVRKNTKTFRTTVLQLLLMVV